MFCPKRLIQQTVDDLFREMFLKARDRAKWLLGQQPAALAEAQMASSSAEKLIEVFLTAAGLEVYFGERRYFIPATSE